MLSFLKKMYSWTFLRFLISGGFNTAITYAIYLMLLMFFPYKTSYTVSFVSGIVIAYSLNRYFVFKKETGIKSKFLFPFIYAIQYFFGLAIVWLSVEHLGIPETIAPIISICLTIPVTYLLSKILFMGKVSE
ncbi:hypothetical protein CCX46_21190 [Pseudomonas sp. RU47]|nr:GtrA family protein [Pseudomonas sp. RU47]AZZ79365.1 hypothetical protein CCX46_21190 [Pseudomonas sp. RU47]